MSSSLQKGSLFRRQGKLEPPLQGSYSRYSIEDIIQPYILIIHSFQDGVILGADSRATNDKIVADKYCPKIHYFAPNIYCCGAGTSADCDQVTKLIASNLELHRLNTGKVVPVVVAERMLKQYLFKLVYSLHLLSAFTNFQNILDIKDMLVLH